MRVALRLIGVGLAFLTSVAFAKDGQPFELLINMTELAPAKILPAPSSANSEFTLTELAEVKSMMSQASPAQRQLAIADAKEKSVGFFADTIKGFDIQRLPQTRQLFEQVRYNER